MFPRALAPSTQRCVWMNAGLLRYRLCDRGFDCERCLLDAAMRGELHGPGTGHPGRETWPVDFVPDDRLYSAGHTWVQALPGEPSVWRLGLDAFAAVVTGSVKEVRPNHPGPPLNLGDPACRIDVGIGTVSLAAPFPCRVLRCNETLQQHPERAINQPYGDGWIVELAVTDFFEPVGLVSPATARDRLALDWCRFCQSLAFDLLANGSTTGWIAAGHGQPLADVRVLLGAPRYLELLREFVH